jgi:hypothetical protein
MSAQRGHNGLRHSLVIVLAGTGLLVAAGPLAGCTATTPAPAISAAQPSPSPTTPGSAIVVDPLTPDHSGWVGALPPPTAGKLLPAVQAQVDMSMPWKFLEFGPNRSTIQVAYVQGDGDCVSPQGFYVAQLRGNVVVAAVSKSANAQSCGNAVVVRRATLSLPVAIAGGVQLEHAPVDPDFSSPNFFQ